MHPRLVILASLILGATPASAQQPAAIELAPEQAVALRVNRSAGAEATVAGRSRAAWTRYDLAVARHLVGQTPPDEPVPYADPLPSGAAMPEAPPVEPGVVHLRFLSIAGRHALLVVENGYDQALVYRARLTEQGETRHTDVCVVVPRLRSYEHWPHTIDRLLLSDFRLVPWDDGQQVTCE